MSATIGVCILAGGEATRLPGKLSLAVGDIPLLVHVFRNVSPGRATWISTNGALAPQIAAHVDAPQVADRWPRRGPLSGLLSTMDVMTTDWVFAAAGDAPFVERAWIDELAAHITPDDDAIVGRHADGAVEPLAALYRREAFLRVGLPVLHEGDAALRTVIAGLRTRFVPVRDARRFVNVNTPAQYAALHPEALA